MKSLILYSTALLGMMTSAFAGKSGPDLIESDIVNSNIRIQKVFHLQKKENSIFENNIPFGEVSFEKEEFYVTYRPSLGLEIFNCTGKSPHPLTKVGLNIQGNGHKGLTQLFSSNNIEDGVVKPFIEYKKQTQVPTEQATIIVDGFSAGAHRAIETATYLKQRDDTKNHNVVVLRYAGANTFDDIAVEGIHKLLDKTNIMDFHAKGDSIAAFLNMPGVTTSLGNQIEFSAETSEDYKIRVSTKAYTCLDPNIKPYIPMLQGPFAQMALGLLKLDSGIVNFLNPPVWELHQPITYAEGSPKAFSEFKKK